MTRRIKANTPKWRSTTFGSQAKAPTDRVIQVEHMEMSRIMESTSIKSTTTTTTTTTTRTNENYRSFKDIRCHRRHFSWQTMSSMLLFLFLLMLHATLGHDTALRSSSSLNVDGNKQAVESGFHPIIPIDIDPEAISRNVFSPAGQYRIFESAESDLRSTTTMRRPLSSLNTQRRQGERDIRHQNHRHNHINTTRRGFVEQSFVEQSFVEPSISNGSRRSGNGNSTADNAKYVSAHNKDEKMNSLPKVQVQIELEQLLAEYVENFFDKGQYEPLPDLVVALQKNNHTGRESTVPKKRGPRDTKGRPTNKLNELLEGAAGVDMPRALESGRLLFFAGLKKVLWPVFMGLQILKSLLFALLLPTLIGSVGKLLGKGIISGSAPLFIRPMDAPQDVDFKDNSFNFDADDNKFTLAEDAVKDADSYAYNQPAASQVHNQYAYNAAAINQQALSRYGMTGDQQKMQDSYLSALQSLSSASFKNSNSISGSLSTGGLSGGGGGGIANSAVRNKPAAPAIMTTFQQFQKVPASSLLLSNYDPFYSPLLSRLDSVFAQLKLNSENEICREKLICLMYANPAKYAPYSNLVSAQLSRELNELRKPTSDNPDILRFFKYMRAAKDGQDGVDCEKSFDGCDEFKDFENPAMVSTYHDINKLVQARKLT